MNAYAHRTIVLQGPETPPGEGEGEGEEEPSESEPVPIVPGPRPPPNDLSARALAALVSQLTTGYPNPDGPEVTPGPVDPYIRKALLAGVALNPQPQSPRSAFLAAVIVEFTERMTTGSELADLIRPSGGERGSVLVAAHVAKFVDEVCGNGFKLRWPFPWPAPGWFKVSLNGADLVLMGTQFQQCAGLALDRDLGHTFADAAHALLEAGAARYV